MSDQIREIAERVRELRNIEGIPAETLAAELGVDLKTYLAWEDSAENIPVGTLFELAKRFNVDMRELISGKSPHLKTYCLTRAEQGIDTERRPAYKYKNLADSFIHKRAEPFMVEVGPESENKAIELNSHPGQEFDYVIEGKLLISVGGHELVLNEGDSLYYDSGEEHGMKALGGKRARFLAVIL